MKKVIYSCLLMGSFIALGGCKEDSFEDLIPGQYEKILYLKTYGQHTLNLFDDGKNVDYKLTVIKTGSNPQATAQAKVDILTQEEIDNDARYKGNNYKVLSPACYEYQAASFQITSAEGYKDVNLSISPSKILEEMAADVQPEHGNYVYILPFRLNSASDNINTEKRDQILKLNVKKLGISFKKGSQLVNLNNESGDEWAFEANMSLVKGINNKWNFTAPVMVDRSQATLDAYNQLNGTNYSMIPEQAIVEAPLPGIFEAGNNEAGTTIRIRRNGLAKGFTYLIPLKLQAIPEMEAMKASDKMHYIVLEYPLDPEKDRIALTAEMLSDPLYCREGEGEGDHTILDHLVDNRNDTYYHTTYFRYSGDPIYGQPVDIALQQPIKSLQIGYITRHNNANGAPRLIKIFVSNDKNTWEELSTISNGLPTETGQMFTSKVLVSEHNFQYVRFSIMKSGLGVCDGKPNPDGSAPCWSLAELQLWGSN